MRTYQCVVNEIAANHSVAAGAVQRFRRRVAGDRSLSPDQRALGVSIADAFAKLNTDAELLATRVSAALLIAHTTDVCRSWVALEGRYVISKSLAWTMGGRPRHAVLPAFSAEDLSPPVRRTRGRE